MAKGYREKTGLNPELKAEVYGQDGFGWYCTKEDAAKLNYQTEPRSNPLFVTLQGATQACLSRQGFRFK
jgi:hypothetical protein